MQAKRRAFIVGLATIALAVVGAGLVLSGMLNSHAVTQRSADHPLRNGYGGDIRKSPADGPDVTRADSTSDFSSDGEVLRRSILSDKVLKEATSDTSVDEVADSDSPPDLVQDVADGLQRGVHHEVLDESLALSDKPDPNARVVAANALASEGTPEAVDLIAGMFEESTSEEERRAIAKASSSITNPASALQLLDDLSVSDEHYLVDAAQRSLANMGTDGQMLALVAGRFRLSNDPVERERLLGVVRLTESAEAVPLLSLLVDQANADCSEPLAHAAIDALGTIGSRPAVESLFTRMEATPKSTSLITASIRRVSGPAARDLLVSIAAGGDAAHTSRASRVAAIMALGNYREAAVVETLSLLAAAGPDDEASRAAQRSLARVRAYAILN